MAAKNTRKNNMNYWVVVYRFAWGLLLVVIVVGVICIFLPKCHFLRSMQRKKEQLASENRDIQVAVSEFRSKQDRFNTDPAFVERTAREEGMIKPDETLFKFTSSNAVDKTGN